MAARRRRQGPTESDHRFHYTYEGGRTIYRDGVPFVTIHREDPTKPVTADEVAREIATMLDRKRWRGSYDR